MYKEAELGLNNEGGGKWLSLRIFLFFMAISNQIHHCVLLIVIAVSLYFLA